MKPNQLNPAQLMMGYLSNEHGKIGQKIVTSEFSKELDAQSTGQAGVGCFGYALPEGGLGSDGTGPFSPLPQASQNQAFPVAKPVDEQRVKALQRLSPQKKPVQVAQEKVREDLVFTDVAAVQRVLAQFRFPAEARQDIKGAEDDQGRISLKTLGAILSRQGQQNPGAKDILPGQNQAEAQDVQQLLNSIRQAHPDPAHQLPQFDAKPGGFYTIEEFKSTLDGVIQQITRERMTSKQGLSGASQPNPSASSKAQETPPSSTAVSPGQVQRIASNLVPSFSNKTSLEGDEKKITSIFDSSEANGKAQQRIGEVTGTDGEAELSMRPNAADLPAREKVAQLGNLRDPMSSLGENTPLKGNEIARGFDTPWTKGSSLQPVADAFDANGQVKSPAQYATANQAASERMAQPGNPRSFIPSFGDSISLNGNERTGDLNTLGIRGNVLQRVSETADTNGQVKTFVQFDTANRPGSERIAQPGNLGNVMPSLGEKTLPEGNEIARGFDTPWAKGSSMQPIADGFDANGQAESSAQYATANRTSSERMAQPGSLRNFMPSFNESSSLIPNERTGDLNTLGVRGNIQQRVTEFANTSTGNLNTLGIGDRGNVQQRVTEFANTSTGNLNTLGTGNRGNIQQRVTEFANTSTGNLNTLGTGNRGNVQQRVTEFANTSTGNLNTLGTGNRGNVQQRIVEASSPEAQAKASVQPGTFNQTGSERAALFGNPKASVPSFGEEASLKGDESRLTNSINTPEAKGNVPQRIAALSETDGLFESAMLSNTSDQANSERMAQSGNLDSSLLFDGGEETEAGHSIHGGSSFEGDKDSGSDASGMAPLHTSGDQFAQTSQEGKEMRERGLANPQMDEQAPQAEGNRVESNSFQTVSSRMQNTNASQPESQTASSSTLSLASSRWPADLSQKIQELQQQNRNQLTLELEPKNLGKLVLRIETDHNQVTAWVSTESDHVKSLLTQNSSILRQHLEEQGLMLGQLFVDVRQESGSPHSQQQNRPSGKPNKSPAAISGLEADEAKAGSSRMVYRQDAEERIINFFA